MGKSLVIAVRSSTKRNNKTRSCTWAKRIYIWRLLSSCRAPFKLVGGVRLGVWGAVLVVCVCVDVGGVVLCRCVCVCPPSNPPGVFQRCLPNGNFRAWSQITFYNKLRVYPEIIRKPPLVQFWIRVSPRIEYVGYERIRWIWHTAVWYATLMGLNKILSLVCLCARISHPFITPRPFALPKLLQYYCATFAQCMTSTRPSLHMPYTIQDWSWQYRVKANTRHTHIYIHIIYIRIS